ncbi:hypothetical protein ACND95_004518, partial [Escherichia coli]
PKTSIICSPMTSLKTSIKTITYLSDTGCLEIQGASLVLHQRVVEILGVSLLEVIATGEAISADAIAGMIRVLHHDELDDLAVKLAIDVLLQDMRLCN